MAKSTPAQRFKHIFDVWMHPGSQPGDRANAERQINAWLKRHNKTRADISAILAQAEADNAAQRPSSPPPSDPRDAASAQPIDSAQNAASRSAETL
jgi:hypothetical protein